MLRRCEFLPNQPLRRPNMHSPAMRAIAPIPPPTPPAIPATGIVDLLDVLVEVVFPADAEAEGVEEIADV